MSNPTEVDKYLAATKAYPATSKVLKLNNNTKKWSMTKFMKNHIAAKEEAKLNPSAPYIVKAIPPEYPQFGIASAIAKPRLPPTLTIPSMLTRPPRVPNRTDPKVTDPTVTAPKVTVPSMFTRPPRVPTLTGPTVAPPRVPNLTAPKVTVPSGPTVAPPRVPTLTGPTLTAPRVPNLTAPTVTGLTVIKAKIDKIKPTYIYMGHGSDRLIEYIDKDNVKYIIPDTRLTVPAGCTYATISETGRPSDMISTYQQDKLINNEETRPYFFKPLESFIKLTNLLTTTNESMSAYNKQEITNSRFHLSTQGDNYTESYCTFLLGLKSKQPGYWIVYKSGMYDISKPFMFKFPESRYDGYIIGPDGVTIDIIDEIYRGSIFPTANEVISKLQELMNFRRTFRYEHLELAVRIILQEKYYKKQKELFHMFPAGNHYNFSCRSFDKTKFVHPDVLAEARLVSCIKADAKAQNCILKTLQKGKGKTMKRKSINRRKSMKR